MGSVVIPSGERGSGPVALSLDSLLGISAYYGKDFYYTDDGILSTCQRWGVNAGAEQTKTLTGTDFNGSLIRSGGSSSVIKVNNPGKYRINRNGTVTIETVSANQQFTVPYNQTFTIQKI